MSDVKKIN